MFSMKKLYSIIIFCLLGQSISIAQSFSDNDSQFNHLYEINKEWSNHQDITNGAIVSFTSDNARIQTHLELVCEYLKTHIPNEFLKQQITNRLNLILSLEGYAKTKVFPINTHHMVRQPYFVDDFGTHCAVGYIMAESGHATLVSNIKKFHNYDYIVDIKTQGVAEWANEFGFTLDELKWIQPAYQSNTVLETVENGTNGSVMKIIKNQYTNRLVFVGNFTEVNDIPCLNIGYYNNNNNLGCLGNGVAGVVNGVQSYSGYTFVFGALEYNFQIYPIARFDGTSWEYISIPDRDGASCSVGYNNGFDTYLEVAIHHPSIANGQEIWFFEDNIWLKKAKVNGVVLDILPSGYGRVFAGHFDTSILFDDFGIAMGTYTDINNVLIKDNFTSQWTGLTGDVCDTVRTVLSVGDALYFGGTCNSSTNSVCLTKYLNSSFQTLLNFNDFSTQQSNISINSMVFDSQTKLILGGDFNINYSFGTYGKKLASYDLVNGNLNAMSNLDSSVNSLVYYNNELYLGGDFVANNLNHLAKINPSATISTNYNSTIELYPNPFLDKISVKGISEINYSISNSGGIIVKEGNSKNGSISNLEHLPQGVYIVKLITKSGIVTTKIVK